MEASIGEAVLQLEDRLHLNREKGLAAFTALVTSGRDGADAELFWSAIVAALRSLILSERWEAKQGGFLAAKAAALQMPDDAPFLMELEDLAMDHLEHDEARVRLAVAECMNSLARKGGNAVFLRTKETILESISANFDRNEAEIEDDQGETDAALPGSPRRTIMRGGDGERRGRSGSPSRRGRYSSPMRRKPDDLRHDTEGWKCLETSFKVLQQVMEGCGEGFFECLTEDMWELIKRAVAHLNRFVRETGFFTLRSLFGVCATGDVLRRDGPIFARVLTAGLRDNWSQVRFAASVATRTFMMNTRNFHRELYPLILPAMCLNRYYVAEGVRIYSQDTWKMVMGTSGREELANCVGVVVEYYVDQSKADNHAVREAACYCMAELMSKLDTAAVSPHVPVLLAALIDCFKDSSWPVRDAACTACGKCVLAYPEASKVILEELFVLWLDHLVDNIGSVRENSAIALGNAMRAYGESAIERVVDQLGKLLPMAKQQPSESQKYGGLSNVTTFGVAHRIMRDNDAELHTNKPMYSCGSLTARAGSTTMLRRGGGCMDHGFSRAKEPWEASDGAIYLLRELSAVAPAMAPRFLPILAELGNCTGFGHFHNLLETLYWQLPTIASNVGKRAFKPFLELFLEPMFWALNCGQQLAEAAAGYCIVKMSEFVGHSIFRGRLTNAQLAAMAVSPFVKFKQAENAMPTATAAGARDIATAAAAAT